MGKYIPGMLLTLDPGLNPNTQTVPEHGEMHPVSVRRRGVLPQPLGPSRL